MTEKDEAKATSEKEVLTKSQTNVAATKDTAKSKENVTAKSGTDVTIIKSASKSKQNITSKSGTSVPSAKSKEKVTSKSGTNVTTAEDTDLLDDLEPGEFEDTSRPCYGISPSFLLDKNTLSFRCLAQQLVSRSSLLRNPLYFPPLIDDGSIEEAFNYVAPEPVYDEVGVTKYQTICKELNIVPMSRVVNSLASDELDLRFLGLNVKQMRAITSTLKINTYIKVLHLEDNWMNVEQASLIGDMLMENSSIRYLNLKECRLGPEGAEKINEGLMMTQFITELDLTYNSLGSEGMANILTGLIGNTSIRSLNLSHNDLREDCAGTLEKIFVANTPLQRLDLSWNFLNTGPALKCMFTNGLTNNTNLVSLNLAWNGISTRKATMPINKFLKKTDLLQELDLSNNMLTGPCLRAIRAGLAKSSSLLKVWLGNNPMTTNEALSVANVLATKTEIPLSYMNLENIFLTKDYIPVRAKINLLKRTIVIGGILSDYEIYGPDISKLLFERCKYLAMKPKKKKAKKDFGHFILSLPEKKLTRQDFEAFIKKQKVKKLDKDLVMALEDRFPAKAKKVDTVAMREAYMIRYPDTTLPPPPPKKKKKKGKKGKKKKTEEKEEKPESSVPTSATKLKQSVSFAADTKVFDTEKELGGLDEKAQNKVSEILYQTMSGNIQKASSLIATALEGNIEEGQVIAQKASQLMQKVLSGDIEAVESLVMSQRMGMDDAEEKEVELTET